MMIPFVLLAGGAAAAALGKTLIYASARGPSDVGLVSLALLVVAIGAYPATFGVQDGLAREVVIPPFLGGLRSRFHAAMASRCFGVIPPKAMFGR
ncbi:MAG: hypothetical protein FJ184_02405 [Gammaproteobacteria bacterium]|nr:hypothetical protein [Gammaproteobacteria bacterium]